MPYPRTVSQIESFVNDLLADTRFTSGTSPLVQDNRPPGATYRTHEGRQLSGFRLGKGSVRVAITAGMHAREWAQPDALLEFAKALLEAYINNRPLIDGAFNVLSDPDTEAGDPLDTNIHYPNAIILNAPAVKRIVERLDVRMLPCVNPDGRHFDMQTSSPGTNPNTGWRKNRQPTANTCGEIGTDVNRNFPIAWDFDTKYFHALTPAEKLSIHTETDNCLRLPDPNQATRRRSQYRGDRVLSQPETQAVKWLVDNHNPQFYLDLHSFKGGIFYPWGINNVQTADPTQHYLNRTLDQDPTASGSGRPIMEGAAYGEYMPQALLDRHFYLAKLMRVNINRCVGANRRAQRRADYIQGSLADTLYPAPGGQIDYVFSRGFTLVGDRLETDPRTHVLAFVAEVGRFADGGFHPTLERYRKVRREIWGIVGTLLDHAASWSP